jgi:hypothetical protein
MQQPVLMLPKFEAKSAHFHAVTIKCQSSMQNWLFGMPGQIFLWTILLVSKKMISIVLTLLFTCLGEFGLSVNSSCFLPKCLCNQWQGHHYTFSEIWTFYAVPLLNSLQKHIRPDTCLQIKACKKSACPPSCVTFCTWTQYYHPLLHHTSTTPVEMAASVLETMNAPTRILKK